MTKVIPIHIPHGGYGGGGKGHYDMEADKGYGMSHDEGYGGYNFGGYGGGGGYGGHMMGYGYRK